MPVSCFWFGIALGTKKLGSSKMIDTHFVTNPTSHQRREKT